MTGPEISIVILTYNRPDMLMSCLRSLNQQSMPGDQMEIVVVDDGSTADTESRVEQFQKTNSNCRYVRQPHRGIPSARNTGIRAVNANIIAIVADDYILPPEYCKTMLTFFLDNPEACIMRCKIISSRDDLSSKLSHHYYETSFLRNLGPKSREGKVPDSFMHYFKRFKAPADRITTEHQLEASGAAGFRASVFEKAGLFDEAILRGEDTEFSDRLRDLGIPIHYNPFLKIKHQYAVGCLDTIQKNFEHGLGYHQNNPTSEPGEVSRLIAKALTIGMARTFLRSIWRARQLGNPLKFIVYCAPLFVFELSANAGYIRGFFTGSSETNELA